MHAIYVALWIAGVSAFAYGGYHHWVFIRRLQDALMRGKIPLSLQAPHMGIPWMIANPGVVPEGAPHRRKAMY